MLNKKLLIVFVFGFALFSCSKTKMPKEVKKALSLAEENNTRVEKP